MHSDEELRGEAGMWMKPAAEVPPGIDAHGFGAVVYGILPMPQGAPGYSTGVLAAPGHVLRGLARQLEVLFTRSAWCGSGSA